MTQPNPLDRLTDPAVRRQIRRTAATLARQRAFVRDDFVDLVADLTVAVAERLPRFDPARGSIHAFVATVLGSAARDMVRARQRDKRRIDLDTYPIEGRPDPSGNRGCRCAESISEADAARLRGDAARRRIDELILARAVEEIAELLPPDLVVVVRVLREDPPAAAARRLGISRRRLRTLIAELRGHFESLGFDEFS